MRRAIKASMITIGGIYLALGIFLLIAPMIWNSTAGSEELRDTVRALIGSGMAIEDDTTIALSLLLIFQGIKLLEHRDETAGSILYSLWLLIPSLLAIEAVDSRPGTIPEAIAAMIPGVSPAPLLFSIFLTIIFRLLISMTRNVLTTAVNDSIALPAPRVKALERPESVDVDIVSEPVILPAEEEEEKVQPEKKASKEDTPDPLSVIEKLIKTSRKDESFASLARKRKKLSAIPCDELIDAVNRIKGFHVYIDSKGQIGNIEDELTGMIQYSFSPFTIIVLNKKGNIKKIRCEDMAVPAFSMEQAMALAEKSIKEYSKGGYSYSALEGELKVSGKDTKIDKNCFIAPWYRKELSYSDPATGDKFFAVDFRLRYAKERGLEPYQNQ